MDHVEFLHDEGTPPMRAFVEAVIEAVGEQGPILVYGHYEKTMLNTLAHRFPDLEPALGKITNRLVDLLSITRKHYYHQDMQGSWSIKAVLPTIAPELSYEKLPGVQDGYAAGAAYLELIADETSRDRCVELHTALLEYCRRDTVALIELMRHLQR